MAKDDSARSARRGPGSRIPAAVGAIPLVGDFVRTADAQAQWMQSMLEQNARLIGQVPATLKSFNDALERFNQTVARLDATVTRIEGASRALTGPLEKVAGTLDPRTLREIPVALDSLRTSLAELTDEAVPALRAAADTQRQVALLQSTVERVVAALGELPGAGIFRRMSAPRADQPAPAASRTPRPSGSAPG